MQRPQRPLHVPRRCVKELPWAGRGGVASMLAGAAFQPCCLGPHRLPAASTRAPALAPAAPALARLLLPAGWTGFNCLLPLKRYCTSKYRLHGFDQGRQPPSWTPPGQEDDMDISPRSHCVGANWGCPAAARCCLRSCHSSCHLPLRSAPAAGFCDEDLGVCYCPSNTTYGRIPAALEAWQGEPTGCLGAGHKGLTVSGAAAAWPALLRRPSPRPCCPWCMPTAGSPPERRGRPMNWWCQPKGAKVRGKAV